jgi:ComF family protein
VDYRYPWDGLVTQFKFHDQPGWAAPLAQLLGDAPGARLLLDEADLVVPMPLSRERLAQRGFNQALAIARRLAPARTDATLLLRLRDTTPQAALDRRQREANVRGAFAVDPLQAGRLRGRHLLIVDDVMTSGASLYAAARVLREAGADRVSALVLARTEEPD